MNGINVDRGQGDGVGQMACCCEQGSETLGSIKRWDFFLLG
jgi:hypothetical protein